MTAVLSRPVTEQQTPRETRNELSPGPEGRIFVRQVWVLFRRDLPEGQNQNVATMILLVGLPGSGKTTVSRTLARLAGDRLSVETALSAGGAINFDARGGVQLSGGACASESTRRSDIRS